MQQNLIEQQQGFFYAVTHKLICRRTPVLNINIRYNMHCILNTFWLLSLKKYTIGDI